MTKPTLTVDEESVCSIQDCNRPRRYAELCKVHNARLEAGNDLQAPLKYVEAIPCAIPHCSRVRASSKTTFCSRHQSQARGHNLTSDQLVLMSMKFDGTCWSCHVEPWVVVDHDHGCCPKRSSCGDCVRGLLCQGCNTGLGLFRDSEDHLLRAIEYLQYTKIMT